MWGIACVMVVKVLHPLVARWHRRASAVAQMDNYRRILCVSLCRSCSYRYGYSEIQQRHGQNGRAASRYIGLCGRAYSGAAIELGTKGEILRTELETKKSELETKKTELEAKKDEAKARMETRRDAYEAFFSMPAVRRKKRLFKAFPDLKSQLRERMIRQTGEEYRAELEDLFEKTFGRK